jgi:transcriptional regulator with XRE-family HTH domain
MVSLRQLRTSRGWTLDQMGEELRVSKATLSRIEAAERLGQKKQLEERVVYPLIDRINEVFKQSYKLEDLEGVTIVPPRPGRPSKKKLAA